MKHAMLAALSAMAMISAQDLAAQQLNPSFFGAGLTFGVGLIQGTGSNNILAAGEFATGTGTALFVSQWSGTAWNALPTGTPTNGGKWGVRVNGNLLGVDTMGVAQEFDLATSSFSTLGGTLTSPTYAIGEVAGRTFVGDSTGIKELIGGVWTQHQPGALTGTVLGIKRDPAGGAFVWGVFTAPGIGAVTLARWDPSAATQWTSIVGVPSGRVERLSVLSDGSIVTANFTPGAAPTPWDLFQMSPGGSWGTLGNALDGGAESAVLLPSGDIVIVGGFTTVSGVSCSGIARLGIASGIGWTSPASITLGIPKDVQFMDDGRLFVGGLFGTINGSTENNIAQFLPDNPGATSIAASGCSGSFGPVTLTPVNDPIIGTTFTSTVTGVGLPTFVILVRGATLIPGGTSLSGVIPNWLPGCLLQVTPTITDLFIPTVSGSVDVNFTIAPSASLVGFTLFQQAIVIDPLEGTASDAVAVTIGDF